MNFPATGILMDVLKGSIVTVALFLAYASLPVFGLLGGLLAPVPAAYYFLRNGKISGGAIVIVSAVLLAVTGDFRILLLYLFQAASVSILLPLFLQRGSTARAIALTSAASLAIILSAAGVFSATSGINPDSEVQKWLTAGMAQTAALYSKSGLKGDELQALQQGMQQAGSVMMKVYPAMLAISQSAVVIITMIVISGFARRGHLELSVGEFREFRTSEHLVWVLIVSGFALLLDHDLVEKAALNILLVVCFAYFFQGLAVMAHFFTRFSVPAFGRFMFYTFLLLQPYLLAGVALLGIFDIWGNFRAPAKQNL